MYTETHVYNQFRTKYLAVCVLRNCAILRTYTITCYLLHQIFFRKVSLRILLDHSFSLIYNFHIANYIIMRRTYRNYICLNIDLNFTYVIIRSFNGFIFHEKNTTKEYIRVTSLTERYLLNLIEGKTKSVSFVNGAYCSVI